MFGELDVPQQKLEFLNDTFHCKSPKYRPNYVEKTLSWNQLGRDCKKTGICMWEMSNRFCKPPFCESDLSESKSKCRRKCKGFTNDEQHQIVERICTDDLKTVAVKTIRLLRYSLHGLLYLPCRPYDMGSTLTAVVFLHYRVSTKVSLEILDYTICRVGL